MLAWYLLHPLHGAGYQFWSGIGSDLGELTLIASVVSIAVVTYRHHECHVDGCRRLGHIDPEVHHPACKDHHSHASKLGRSNSHG